MRILVVNGPNLNLLGTREPDVYGSTTLDDLNEQVVDWATTLGVVAECRQSNDEAQIIDLIQQFDGDGIVINPGALTHTSHAIGDAIRGVETPVVEVHISNVKDREPWRANSVIADACVHSIFGRGIQGYRGALQHLVNRAAMSFEPVPYGPHEDQIGDLRRGGQHLVVLVHGGLWLQKYAKDTIESLAVDLGNRGYTTWNLEYRRLGSGGGWPASGHDILTALDFIPQLDTEPSRIAIVSHSAGSQLAMWAAERSQTSIGLHIAMGPLLDLDAAVVHGDTGAAECARMLSEGAPRTNLPIHVETAILHGNADQIVPVERSAALADESSLELHRPDGDHFVVLDPQSQEWAWVVARLGQLS